jgi:hypothetical protein
MMVVRRETGKLELHVCGAGADEESKWNCC